MARTGASNVCRSVASVPFFGGGGRFGRSWGMRQSLGAPVPTRLCWGARRARAVLAVAPSNAMRAACGELAVPLLIVAMKTYRKQVLGRAMVPRLWRMGGAKGCTQNGLLLKLFHARALQGSSGRLQESLLWFFLDRAQAKCARVLQKSPPVQSTPAAIARRCLPHYII